MVSQENGSPGLESEALRIIERDNESMSERVSSFVIEFTDNTLRVAREGEGRIALQLLDFLAETTFQIHIFR